MNSSADFGIMGQLPCSGSNAGASYSSGAGETGVAGGICNASLTKRQMVVMRFVQGYIDTHGFAPTFREIMAACRMKSTAEPALHLKNIEERGFIRRLKGRERAIEIVRRVSLPSISGSPLYFVEHVLNHISYRSDGVYVTVNKGAFEVIIDAVDLPLLLNRYVNFAKTRTTAYVATSDKFTHKSVRLARLIMNPQHGWVVDHINGNPLDNRRANLRVVSSQDNNRNRAKQSNATSIYKGVCKTPSNTWQSNININYKGMFLGTFATEIDAAKAYDAAARLHFGDCATLNFPNEGEQSAHRPRTISFHTQDL